MPEVRTRVRKLDGSGGEGPVGMQLIEDQAAKFGEGALTGKSRFGNREGLVARERNQERRRFREAGQLGPGARYQTAFAAQRQRFGGGL